MERYLIESANAFRAAVESPWPRAFSSSSRARPISRQPQEPWQCQVDETVFQRAVLDVACT